MTDEWSEEQEKLLIDLPPEHAAFVREQVRLAPPQTAEQIRDHAALILASRRRRQQNS